MRIRYSGSATGVLSLDGMNEVTIGRAKNSQIRTDDATVSRKHAVLRRAAGQWVIEDLGSSHGVLLAGHKVSRHVLRAGDELHLGKLVLTVEEAPPSFAVTITDPMIAASAGAAVTIGKSFAFIGRDLLDQPSLQWLRPFVDPSAIQSAIVPLIGAAPIDLPGVRVSPLAPPRFAATSVTSDRALYREGTDTVNLLVVDPLGGDREVVLEVRLDGTLLTSRPLRLSRGAATAALGDLPAGSYEISVQGAPEDATPCTFTVATYRLSPLVAALDRKSLDGDRLVLDLRLTTFGAPVEGEVDVELQDDGDRVARDRVTASDGKARAAFKLTGEGPHVVNVQLVADPGRTASIPIVGSRAADREDTVFSTVGPEILGSLLPSDDADSVRGLWLRRGGTSSSPIALDRADTRRPRLRALTAIERLCVVICDPCVPAARKDAVDALAAPHPAQIDPQYAQAEQQFLAGQIAESCETFIAARERLLPSPHPNYAYFIACCHARLGDIAAAREALRAALRDGWKDIAHLAADEDLAALRGDPVFASIVSGGVRVIEASLAADQVLELDVPSPLALLAIGAYAGGVPWEGHATIVAPTRLTLEVEAPPSPRPGSDMTVAVTTNAAAAVYVIVKDARLLSTDTPTSMLASRMKAFATTAGSLLGKGKPTAKLAALLSGARMPLPPPGMPGGGIPPVHYRTELWETFQGMANDFDCSVDYLINEAMRYYARSKNYQSPGGPPAMSGGMPQMIGGPPPMPAGAAMPTMAARSAPPMPAAGPPRPGMAMSAMRPPSPSQSAPMPPPMAPRSAPAPAAAPMMLARDVDTGRVGAAAGVVNAEVAGAPEGAGPGPARAIEEAPELLFAGLVPIVNGRGAVTVALPEAFADYVIEAFAVDGTEWATAEARVRAELVHFAALELPAFVHPSDTAVGRLTAGCGAAGMTIAVTRDGAPVAILANGQPVAAGTPIAGPRTEITFLTGPGDHVATVTDLASGEAIAAKQRVDPPGALRRLTRTVRFLRRGERVALADDPSIVTLRALPGLDKPFKLLCDATADYGHACCEQTAAKILAACSMYLFAVDDPRRRGRAEEIILAGVRREHKMWMKGRGFRMYPESGNEVNTYYGPKTARYLWNLDLLRGADPSRALVTAIDEALEMARDATQAYRLAWPPAPSDRPEEAYGAARFGEPKQRPQAADRMVGWAERAVATLDQAPRNAVAFRADAAYAAAALLCGGGDAAVPLALRLANRVIGDLGAEGRLYSTVDSVAAIALMAELQAAKIIGGGHALIDGKRTALGDAAALGEVGEISAESATIAVEVTRIIEEDWAKFASAVPVTVTLTNKGRATTRATIGDPLDLVVRLDGGYETGDLVWVALPDALSRVTGGGQIKRFSVDPAGKSEVTIPLAATALTLDRHGETGAQRFAVCVRNMFDEERAGNPGYLDVSIVPPKTGGALARATAAFRRLFT